MKNGSVLYDIQERSFTRLPNKKELSKRHFKNFILKMNFLNKTFSIKKKKKVWQSKCLVLYGFSKYSGVQKVA